LIYPEVKLGFGSSTTRNLLPNYTSLEKEKEKEKQEDKGSKTKIKKPFSSKDRLIFATSSNTNTQLWIDNI
tara:strand:- start:193 stop:405 length:213 start_codon:yes stop_codon:yes gene_type:complete